MARSFIAGPGEMSIPFQVMKNPPLYRSARLGERSGGARRFLREDLDDHRRIFDDGDDLQSVAAVRAVFDVDVVRSNSRTPTHRPTIHTLEGISKAFIS
jgi:hypothetical protein